MISVKHLTKTYKSKNKFDCVALDGISFDLPDSGMIFILGKSGSGKSTLLNMLGGLDNFDSGEICVDGANLSQFSQKDYYDYRGNYVGFVFQDYHLLDELTIEQNVALNLDISAISHDDKITLALQKVGMQKYATRYPQELSGGQKQRIATARAICKDPAVILCDEPTGNLDANTSKQILDLLKEISSDKLC
ncbi:MAG: ABC transporter ATP-binding protein [Clostridiales bacterium]|nr:ABC transporter ATP-binding protein [Clostridiales bacterium]